MHTCTAPRKQASGRPGDFQALSPLTAVTSARLSATPAAGLDGLAVCSARTSRSGRQPKHRAPCPATLRRTARMPSLFLRPARSPMPGGWHEAAIFRGTLKTFEKFECSTDLQWEGSLSETTGTPLVDANILRTLDLPRCSETGQISHWNRKTTVH